MKKILIFLFFISSFCAIAQRIPINNMVVKSSITGTEKIPCSGSGNPALTPNMIKDFVRTDTVGINMSAPFFLFDGTDANIQNFFRVKSNLTNGSELYYETSNADSAVVSVKNENITLLSHSAADGSNQIFMSGLGTNIGATSFTNAAVLHVKSISPNTVIFRVDNSSGTKAFIVDQVGGVNRLSFFNTTPTQQATNATAIDQLLVNYGLRASGGSANFTTSILAPASTISIPSIRIPSGTFPTSPTDGDIGNVSNNIIFRNGSVNYTLAKTLTNTATLDFASTGAGAVADLTITVTGAAANDPCTVGPPNGSVTATACFTCWVSSTNTVTVRFSPKATEDPASGLYRVAILHY